MGDKYDKNGSDFKRNSNQGPQGDEHEQDGEDTSKLNEKAGEYMRELLSEKIKLNNSKFPVSARLIDQEVVKVQASGRIPNRDTKYLDVFREKPIKVTVKVLVPIKEHPKFNFVGKLLGPKGNTMKQLQEETMCKMAILGRGSMRDRQKEEELRNSLEPKYAHLTDELHVEISALAPPAEAHARIAYALAEVKKYLLPDSHDMIRHNPMRDMIDRDTASRPPLLQLPGYSKAIVYNACTVTKRSLSYQDPVQGAPPPPMPRPAPPRMPPSRPMQPAKSKVFSILDRARSAMETSSYGYDDPYGMPEPPARPPRAAEPDYYYERNAPDRFYEEEYYKEEPREYKNSSREVGTRRPGPGPAPARHFPRPAPYQRPK
ncbi:KH domain-containing, RNA-binding, signal transduction-associated protein 2-like isoform X1 [Colias croceus]|uniref:KH domain-containing, RNA-binding, signal transduction-associated protein 2-like isoform X1 n=1 Tax=Colias crocea TaxID=72248 RepID=UPI001E27FD59|nr:KH domain-containing, RNA-binding, signal transduction-associated protein 2-like isoform X1 [Colias croceus]XP_045505121.1 KH domain-containing, RNA-binding, signal transduction-associated protein 2-like isoform X1 [Colias croceus]XP_045505122.1 KH domain-containing, RNA-binding, signal transduction-associated protein 2-like isoform X1 [Colias croceus]